MSLKLLVLAVLLCLAVTFSPITNLQCSPTASGSKANQYSGEIISPLNEVGFVKLGSAFRTTITVNSVGSTATCTNYNKDDTYRVVCFTPKLLRFTQEYVSSTQTEILDYGEGFIFVKEYTDDTKTDYKIGIYFFDNYINGSDQPLMGRVTLNRPDSTLEFNKFLQFGGFLGYDAQGANPYFYMIFTSDSSTEILQKNINSPTGNAEIRRKIASTRVDALGGSVYAFYDKLSEKYYIRPTDVNDNNYILSDAKHAVGGTGLGNVIAGTVAIHQFTADRFIIYSYVQNELTVDAYYGFYDGRLATVSQGSFIGGSGIPSTFGDYENFIFIAKGALVWMRSVYRTDYENEVNVFSNLAVDSADWEQARLDFAMALAVSFDDQKVFIITTSSMVIYQVSKVAGVYATNRISEILMAQSLSSKINGSSELTLKMAISCKCTRTQISSLVCFSQTLKCVSQVSPVTVACTVPYLDEFPTTTS